MVSIHSDAPLGVLHREMFKTATPLRRSSLPLALSLLLHGGVLVGLVALAAAVAGRPAELTASLTFVSVSASPRVLLELSAPEPAPEARPESLPVLDFPEPALEPIVAESITRTEPETEPVPEPEPAPENPAVPAAPPPPSIDVGRFGGRAQVADRVQLDEVSATGFAQEAPVAVVQLDEVSATGFAQGVPVAVVQLDEVSATGFAQGAPVAVVQLDEVSATGFAQEAPVAVASAAPEGPPNAAVEVVFKPIPEYSLAAREAGVEGDVALEVDFSSSGTVRVLRVVEGLGHGLDEIAIRAAEQMSFTPAIRNGHKVDTRAIVYIVFRLT